MMCSYAKILVLVVTVTFSCNACSDDDTIKATDILHDISTRGARVVVTELYSDHEQWRLLLERISSGNKEWLVVASSLHTGADGGAREMLTLSVGEALKVEPVTVFENALPEFNVSLICGQIDTDRYETYKQSVEELQKREDKVALLNVPKLHETVTWCLSELEGAKEKVFEYYNKGSS